MFKLVLIVSLCVAACLGVEFGVDVGVGFAFGVGNECYAGIVFGDVDFDSNNDFVCGFNLGFAF